MSGSTPTDVLDLTVDPNAVDELLVAAGYDPACVRLVRDDFAGPGGWATGIRDLLEAHDLIEVGLEWDAAAVETRRANGHHAIRTDVAAYPVTPFIGRTVGYIGSPPCQTFSLAGKGGGRAHLAALCDEVYAILTGRRTYEEAMARLEACGALNDDEGNPDPRNGLILVPARVIRQLTAADGQGPVDLEWVALEQVPQAGPVFDAYVLGLRDLGFSATSVKLNAADYGVPQTRERRFVLASRRITVGVPEPTHARGGEPPSLFGPGRLPWVSMARALGWGMAARPYVTVAGGRPESGGTDAQAVGGTGGRATIATELDAGRWVARAGGGTNDALPQRFDPLTEEAGRFLIDRSQRGAPLVDVGVEPSPTMTAGAVGKGVWTLEDRRAGRAEEDLGWVDERPATVVASREMIVQHPGATKNRHNGSEKTRNDGLRITEAEGGILQGFPADYEWTGRTKSKRWEQIGNVVCPPVARVIVAELLEVDAPPLPWHSYAFADREPADEEAALAR